MFITSFIIVPLAFAIGVLGDIDPGRLGDLVCGNFATGDAKNLHDLAWDNMYGLDSHGSTANPRHDIFVVEAKKCKRVNCWNTSALYVCNDSNEKKAFLYFEVGESVIKHIIHSCCTTSQHPPGHHAVSGQLFFKEDFNVIAAYANCAKGDDFRPGDYPGPGPNGWCT